MKPVGINDAKRHFSRLLRRAAAGEEIIIKRGRVPVACLVPYQSADRRTLGIDIGKFEVPEDFNRPTADESEESAALDSSPNMLGGDV